MAGEIKSERWARSFRNGGRHRAESAPETFSLKTRSHPAAFNASICAAWSCVLELTRAYPIFISALILKDTLLESKMRDNARAISIFQKVEFLKDVKQSFVPSKGDSSQSRSADGD
ncbi:hypothetical protein ACVWXP_000213 [Bradyrhizobium sp. USDA 4463]